MHVDELHIPQTMLNQYLAQLILADLKTVVDTRQAGHCIQITDLPTELMNIICQQLRVERPACETYVLNPNPEQTWQVTSTKLVERRNAGEAVIVVFLPPDLHTSAEDSFDISTFERFPISHLYQRLRTQLVRNLPVNIRSIVEEIIREFECRQDDLAICRYLLAIQHASDKFMAIGLGLYHLGLVPDLKLWESRDVLRPQLNRNKKAVEILSNTDAPIFSKIQALNLKEERTPKLLYHFFEQQGSFTPSVWLPAIVRPECIDTLTFDKWDFREPVTGTIDEITFVDVGTSEKNDDGYPMFTIQTGKKHENKLKVTWETTPPPLQCKDLTAFTIEIMQDGSPISEARTIKVGTSPQKRRSTTLKDLEKLILEEGLYYFRISAWAASGVLLDSAESESIFFKSEEPGEDGGTGIPPKTQRQFTVTSVYEAMLRTQVNLRQKDKTIEELLENLDKTKSPVEMNWITPERRIGGRYTDQFTIKYNPANQYVLPVNAILRRIEQETLADADSLGRWELDLSHPVTMEIQLTLQSFEGIEYEILDAFLLARKDLFLKILNQSAYPSIPFLVETSNLVQWEDDIIQYAQAYLHVLTQFMTKLDTTLHGSEREKLLHCNRQITNLDTIRLCLPDGKQAYLIAPTHPLKMLWALQYARAARQWLHELEHLPANQISWSTFANFLPKLSSFNIPQAIVNEDGRLLVNVDSFSPFWSIFVPLDTPDTRALVGRIKTLLGSPEADERFTTITGAELARIVERYLTQHAYVKTLRMNVVQPGSGAILTDLLLALETNYPYLRYHLQLFSEDFRREELGGALDELMSPSEKRSGSEALDAFLTASQNVLFPKLTYSKHHLAELLLSPENSEAHITILFDAFKVEVQTMPISSHSRSNHLYGLIHEYTEQFSSTEGNICWQRQIIPQRGLDVDDDKPGHDTMVNLFQAYNQLVVMCKHIV